MSEPTVSVIIATHNRQWLLERCLQALASQTYPLDLLEVWVAADGCTDGTVAWLRAYPAPFRLCLLVTAGEGAAAARNRALERATGELTLFLDDDVIAEPGLVAAHVACQAQQRGGVTLGTALLPPEARCPTWLQWEARQLSKLYRRLASGERSAAGVHFYSGNVAAPTEALREIGGYDASFSRGEDVDLGCRLEAAGLVFTFCPEARAFHYQTRSLTDWLRVQRDYGAVDVRLLRERDEERFARRLEGNFRSRHRLLRATLGLAWRWRGGGALLAAGARLLTRMTGRRRLWWLPAAALSWLANWSYWEGAAEEWGAPPREILRELREAEGRAGRGFAWRAAALGFAAATALSALGAVALWRHRPSQATLATVGGAPIRQRDLDLALNRLHGAEQLTRMITERAVLGEARRLGVLPSDTAVDEELDRLLSEDPGMLYSLAARQVTEAQLRRDVRGRLALRNLRVRPVSVSEAEVRAFFEANRAQFRVRGRLVAELVLSPDARETEVVHRLLSAGLPARLVAERVHGSLPDTVGRRVTLTAGMLDAQTERKLMAYEPGEVTEPLPFAEGTGVLRIVEKQPSRPMTFAEAREAASVALRLRQAPSEEQTLDEVLARAGVTLDSDRYREPLQRWLFPQRRVQVAKNG